MNFNQTNIVGVVTPHSSNIQAGDFIGTDVVFYSSVTSGKVSIGISRKSGQGGVSGSGAVARIKFKSENTTATGTAVQFSFSTISANDPSGATISLTPNSLTVNFSGIVVWPGDTNDDHLVNQADVLPLGLFWGSTGPARPGASVAWTGQQASSWSPENATYADANGDGIINQADVLPIGLHWGKHHSLMAATPNADLSDKLNKFSSAATLKINLTGDTSPNGICYIELVAEDVADLFGISFEMTFSSASFVESLTEESGSWLGNDIVSIVNINISTGIVGYGMSRKAGQGGISGTGVIARLKVKLKDIASVETLLLLQNVLANNASGAPITFSVVNQSITEVELVHQGGIPNTFVLNQNYPNPFNPETSIEYNLPQPAEVMLSVFDINGKEVRQLLHETKTAGSHSTLWDARDIYGQFVASGTYFYRIEITSQNNSFVDVKKMIFMK